MKSFRNGFISVAPLSGQAQTPLGQSHHLGARTQAQSNLGVPPCTQGAQEAFAGQPQTQPPKSGRSRGFRSRRF